MEMNKMVFWSGTSLLKKEQEVFADIFKRRNLNPLHTALFRLSNDLDCELQIKCIKKTIIKHCENSTLNYSSSFNQLYRVKPQIDKDSLEIILVNPIISEDEYPISKCSMYAIVNFYCEYK